MRMLFAATALALISCEPGQGSDGYAFDHCPLGRSSFTVTLVQHQTMTQLRSAADAAGAAIESGRDVFAWGTYSPSRPVCTIHVVEPEREWRPERWGHELAHCACGTWHD